LIEIFYLFTFAFIKDQVSRMSKILLNNSVVKCISNGTFNVHVNGPNRGLSVSWVILVTLTLEVQEFLITGGGDILKQRLPKIILNHMNGLNVLVLAID